MNAKSPSKVCRQDSGNAVSGPPFYRVSKPIDGPACEPDLKNLHHRLSSSHAFIMNSMMALWYGLVLTLGITTSHALQAHLSATAPGTLISGQSFNETRGVDVTVLAAVDLAVSSMKLEGLNLGGAASAQVGARIYNSASQILVGSEQVTVTVGGMVMVPISANLEAGANYRVAFYVATTPAFLASGTFVSNSGGFPYTESTGLFRINSAHAKPADGFPDTPNIFVPQISLQVRPTCFSLSADAPGPLISGQSFNETRGVDVSVLAAVDLAVSSMKLAGLSIGSAASALVGARIYNSTNQVLVGSGAVTVTAGGSVTVPISATLEAGANYRVAFYVATTPASLASGTFVSNSGGFPYTESTGLLRINSAHANPADVFPNTSNIFVPQICLQARPACFSLSADAPGPLIAGQSFNETRGVDVTVLTAADLAVSSMKLAGLGIGSATSAVVGARIYNSTSQVLVGAGEVTVTAGGSVTVPISATLGAGGNYRVAFYVATTPASLASGTFVSNSGGFPFMESAGLFRINSAHAKPADVFPSTSNNFVPQICLQAAPQVKLQAILENGQFVMTWPSIIGDQFSVEESSSLNSFAPLPSHRLITAKGITTRVAVDLTSSIEVLSNPPLLAGKAISFFPASDLRFRIRRWENGGSVERL